MTDHTTLTERYGLSGRGSDLALVLLDSYDFDEHEMPVLIEACRTLSLLDRLEAQLADGDLMVRGYSGQPVSSPLLSELRAHRQTYLKLYSSLNLPELDAEGAPVVSRTPTAIRAQKAAQARWSKAKGGA